jgi:hypothetical protein
VNTLSEKAVDFSNTSAQIYAEKDGGFSRKDGGYQEQMEVASAFSESRKCLQICLVKKTYQEQAVDFSNTLAEILRNLRREIERGGGFSRKEIEQGSNLQLEPI